MAGDWIKMRLDLRDDPSVFMVSAALSCEVDLVVGKLHRLWSWFNQQTRDGLAPLMTADWIDKYVDRPGFAQALADAGWLILHSPQGVQIPKFEKHMGESAKRRLDDAARKRAIRVSEAKSNRQPGDELRTEPDTVRKSSRRAAPLESDTVPKHCRRAAPSESDKSSLREEKSREEGEKMREENWRAEKKEEAAEESPPPEAALETPAASALLCFPTVNPEVRWTLPAEQLQSWVQDYPTVDVPADLRRAVNWLEADPSRLQTPANMHPFLVDWLNRASRHAERTGQARSPESRAPTDEDLANWTPYG